MDMLITGGAGFVGSSLAIFFKESGYGKVTCLDNLKRRGSELVLPRLKRHGIGFIHGDIRNRADVADLPAAGVLIECSAEPSVLAGYGTSPLYLLDTNVSGAINCFEWARRAGATVIFLSSSRVYPYDSLSALPLTKGKERFIWQEDEKKRVGAGSKGICEDFPLQGIRSLYGASKLAAELILAEYGAAYEIPYVINRCGVLTGPWQFGKTDQGVFMYWLLNHYFERPLQYIGYGGEGKQVRDLLHVHDLAKLVKLQLDNTDKCNRKTYNVGGGIEVSLSLRETTLLCRELTGHEVPIKSVPPERPADIPWYITDYDLVGKELGWKPQYTPAQVLREMFGWIQDYEQQLLAALD